MMMTRFLAMWQKLWRQFVLTPISVHESPLSSTVYTYGHWTDRQTDGETDGLTDDESNGRAKQ